MEWTILLYIHHTAQQSCSQQIRAKLTTIQFKLDVSDEVHGRSHENCQKNYQSALLENPRIIEER